MFSTSVWYADIIIILLCGGSSVVDIVVILGFCCLSVSLSLFSSCHRPTIPRHLLSPPSFILHSSLSRLTTTHSHPSLPSSVPPIPLASLLYTLPLHIRSQPSTVPLTLPPSLSSLSPLSLHLPHHQPFSQCITDRLLFPSLSCLQTPS